MKLERNQPTHSPTDRQQSDEAMQESQGVFFCNLMFGCYCRVVLGEPFSCCDCCAEFTTSYVQKKSGIVLTDAIIMRDVRILVELWMCVGKASTQSLHVGRK